MSAMGGSVRGMSTPVNLSNTEAINKAHGGPALNAQSAAGALAAYMGENGVQSFNPDSLYQLAFNNKSASPTVADAAKYMLQHPDVFQQIETHDVSGNDGIAGANDFQWAAQGGLSTEQPSDSADTGEADAPQAKPLNAQSAAGALASYMGQNGMGAITPSQLYKLAFNPPPGTSPTVQSAAKYMLQHASTFQKIETHDVPGSDGIAGINDLQWAAQGGLPHIGSHGISGSSSQPVKDDPAQTAAQGQAAAGALAAYMSQHNIPALNVNQLYALAHKAQAGTPDAVANAAKFMLQNPDTFEQIETHDVAGADGLAGKNDFDWAAQGGLTEAAQNTDSADASQPDAEIPANDYDTLVKMFSGLAFFGGLSSGSAQSAKPTSTEVPAESHTNSQSASGALAAYMSEHGISSLDPSRLYQLAKKPPEGTPPEVSNAASYMLKHSHVYNQIETHDVKGSDGVSGISNFQWAAQGGLRQHSNDLNHMPLRA